MPAAHRQASHAGPTQKPLRSRMLAAVNIKWSQLRPDLKHDKEALHDELLTFAWETLRMKRELTSLRNLSDRQLGLLLDALSALESQPDLPHSQAMSAPQPTAMGAEIIHLASAEQVHTITKILDFLGWSQEFREGFIQKRFRRTSPAMLSPRHANSLIMILLNTAAARVVKSRGSASRISRKMIAEEIPALKARLGIDRKEGSD